MELDAGKFTTLCPPKALLKTDPIKPLVRTPFHPLWARPINCGKATNAVRSQGRDVYAVSHPFSQTAGSATPRGTRSTPVDQRRTVSLQGENMASRRCGKGDCSDITGDIYKCSAINAEF